MDFLQKLLNSYSHRFVPSLFARLAATELGKLPKTVHVPESQLNSQLLSVFLRLAKEFPDINFHEKRLDEQIRSRFREVLFDTLGFELERKPSTIAEAGQGVFLKRGSIEKAGRVICVYPGTIYYPGDPIFLPSIGNSFVLRCKDGILVDGNDSRLSRRIFESCSRRDLGAQGGCDETWMSTQPISSFNLGQYINNARTPDGHNVQYMELDLHKWPIETRRFLPYAIREPRGHLMRVVCLVSTTRIQAGQELFSAYIST